MSEQFLILDDDPVFAQTLARGLTRRGFHAHVAADGQAAVSAAQQRGFDYVSIDLHLEQDSGLHWILPIRQVLPQARILVLTGYASIATTVQAIKAGADNYLPKPANIDSILSALQNRDADSTAATGDEVPNPDEPDDSSAPQPLSVRRLEWEHIQRVLSEHQGNISQAARALNMHRRTLQRKLGKKPSAQ